MALNLADIKSDYTEFCNMIADCGTQRDLENISQHLHRIGEDPHIKINEDYLDDIVGIIKPENFDLVRFDMFRSLSYICIRNWNGQRKITFDVYDSDNDTCIEDADIDNLDQKYADYINSLSD